MDVSLSCALLCMCVSTVGDALCSFPSPRAAQDYVAQTYHAPSVLLRGISLLGIVYGRTGPTIVVIAGRSVGIDLFYSYKVFTVKEVKHVTCSWLPGALPPVMNRCETDAWLLADMVDDFPYEDLHFYAERMDCTRQFPSVERCALQDPDSEFVWNDWLTLPFAGIGLRHVCAVLLQGVATSSRVEVPCPVPEGGQAEEAQKPGACVELHMSLISRKSVLNPGTRYNARGLSRKDASPGNEIESDLILWTVVRHADARGAETRVVNRWGSCTWRRGTVPIHWKHTLGSSIGQAQIQIRNSPFECAAEYWRRILGRFGGKSAMCVNLLRADDGKYEAETRLSSYFQDSLRYCEAQLNLEPRTLRMTVFDWHTTIKRCGMDDAMSALFCRLGAYFGEMDMNYGTYSGEVGCNIHNCHVGLRAEDFEFERRQDGVFRVNCADSLDRTNIACFFLSFQIVAEFLRCQRTVAKDLCDLKPDDLQVQWYAFGLRLPELTAALSDDVIAGLAELFVLNGDVCSLLYTSSIAMHSDKIRKYAPAITKAGNNTIIVLSRRLNNVARDSRRQLILEGMLGLSGVLSYAARVPWARSAVTDPSLSSRMNARVAGVTWYKGGVELDHVLPCTQDLTCARLLLESRAFVMPKGPVGATHCSVVVAIQPGAFVDAIGIFPLCGASPGTEPAAFVVSVSEYFDGPFISIYSGRIPAVIGGTNPLVFQLPTAVALPRDTCSIGYDFREIKGRLCSASHFVKVDFVIGNSGPCGGHEAVCPCPFQLFGPSVRDLAWLGHSVCPKTRLQRYLRVGSAADMKEIRVEGLLEMIGYGMQGVLGGRAARGDRTDDHFPVPACADKSEGEGGCGNIDTSPMIDISGGFGGNFLACSPITKLPAATMKSRLSAKGWVPASAMGRAMDAAAESAYATAIQQLLGGDDGAGSENGRCVSLADLSNVSFLETLHLECLRLKNGLSTEGRDRILMRYGVLPCDVDPNRLALWARARWVSGFSVQDRTVVRKFATDCDICRRTMPKASLAFDCPMCPLVTCMRPTCLWTGVEGVCVAERGWCNAKVLCVRCKDVAQKQHKAWLYMVAQMTIVERRHLAGTGGGTSRHEQLTAFYARRHVGQRLALAAIGERTSVGPGISTVMGQLADDVGCVVPGVVEIDTEQELFPLQYPDDVTLVQSVPTSPQSMPFEVLLCQQRLRSRMGGKDGTVCMKWVSSMDGCSLVADLLLAAPLANGALVLAGQVWNHTHRTEDGSPRTTDVVTVRVDALSRFISTSTGELDRSGIKEGISSAQEVDRGMEFAPFSACLPLVELGSGRDVLRLSVSVGAKGDVHPDAVNKLGRLVLSEITIYSKNLEAEPCERLGAGTPRVSRAGSTIISEGKHGAVWVGAGKSVGVASVTKSPEGFGWLSRGSPSESYPGSNVLSSMLSGLSSLPLGIDRVRKSLLRGRATASTTDAAAGDGEAATSSESVSRGRDMPSDDSNSNTPRSFSVDEGADSKVVSSMVPVEPETSYCMSRPVALGSVSLACQVAAVGGFSVCPLPARKKRVAYDVARTLRVFACYVSGTHVSRVQFVGVFDIPAVAPGTCVGFLLGGGERVRQSDGEGEGEGDEECQVGQAVRRTGTHNKRVYGGNTLVFEVVGTYNTPRDPVDVIKAAKRGRAEDEDAVDVATDRSFARHLRRSELAMPRVELVGHTPAANAAPTQG